MDRSSQFLWIPVLFVIVVTLAENRNHSRKRQLREFLLESEEDMIPKPEDSFDGTSRSQIDGYSRPKYDPRWFTALSKIARIRTADGRSWNISEDVKKEHQDGQTRKVDYSLDDFSKRKVDLERNKDGLTVSSGHFRPRKFHCRPIQDVYVPKVDRTLPAYTCKLGSRTFVLTSERFLQDRRSYVDVNIDDVTFLGLSSGIKSTNNSAAVVIPATLVFNKEQNYYGIKRT